MSIYMASSLADLEFVNLKLRSTAEPYVRSVMDYVRENYRLSNQFRRRVVDLIRYILFRVAEGELTLLPDSKCAYLLLDENYRIQDSGIQKVLKKWNMWFDYQDVEWDFEVSDSNTDSVDQQVLEDITQETEEVGALVVPVVKFPDVNITSGRNNRTHRVRPGYGDTDMYPFVDRSKEGPMKSRMITLGDCVFPMADFRRIWLEIPGFPRIPMSSLPVPECLADCSVTTDVDMMTPKDLMRMFSTELLKLRKSELYTKTNGYPEIVIDDDLGAVFPVEGFSVEEVRTNIIEYPHLYKLDRLDELEDRLIAFWTHIELDGELYKITDVLDNLPDLQKIPHTKEYLREYVIRRYLLERDRGIKHNYPMRGDLRPFITLINTPEWYQKEGYLDVVKLARNAVVSRVAWFRSVNPVVREAKRVGLYPYPDV